MLTVCNVKFVALNLAEDEKLQLLNCYKYANIELKHLFVNDKSCLEHANNIMKHGSSVII